MSTREEIERRLRKEQARFTDYDDNYHEILEDDYEHLAYQIQVSPDDYVVFGMDVINHNGEPEIEEEYSDEFGRDCEEQIAFCYPDYKTLMEASWDYLRVMNPVAWSVLCPPIPA